MVRHTLHNDINDILAGAPPGQGLRAPRSPRTRALARSLRLVRRAGRVDRGRWARATEHVARQEARQLVYQAVRIEPWWAFQQVRKHRRADGLEDDERRGIDVVHSQWRAGCRQKMP